MSRASVLRLHALWLMAVSVGACSSPAAPTPGPTTPDSITLSGSVSNSQTTAAIADAAVQWQSAGAARTTRTNAAGTFAFAAVAGGAGTLTVSADGFHVVTKAATITQTSALDITLTPDAQPAPRTTVQGTVMSESTQAPIEKADIDLRVGIDQKWRAVTDVAGHWSVSDVPVGAPADLRVDAAGYTSVGRQFTITEGLDVRTALRTLTPPPPVAFTTTMRLVDAFSRGGVAGLVITGNAILSPPTDAGGQTVVSAAAVVTAPRRITIDGSGIVPRDTLLRVPGTDATLDVIPSDFDLTCFDEMARGQRRIIRWPQPPPLFVHTQTVLFTGNFGSGTTQDTTITPSEVSAINADMTSALASLTGSSMRSFQSTTDGSVPGPPGTTVTYAVSGQISVYRIDGLAGAGYAGGTLVEVTGDRLTGAVVFLDLGYDTSGGYTTKIRTHELGHAMGYEHPNCNSIMTITANGSDTFTAFDRLAMALAYSRPPGNRSPDIDPDGGPSPNRAGRRWTTFVGFPTRR